MSEMQASQFDEQGRFILAAYDQAHPFSSFLPGIGGLLGIPMWVFYTNRGQAITSFGVESKDHPIMEFQPAHKAYQLTATLGFRTFLKSDQWFKEPFSPWDRATPQRTMHVGMNEIEIRETDLDLGLETSVVYFTLLNEPFTGLVRQISFRNIGKTGLEFEVLDGMPALIPYGVDDGLIKHIGRTIEAWMEVFEVESRLPFYRLRATPGDTSDVRTIESGNYALAFSDGELLPAYVDPTVVFRTDTSFSYPQGMMQGLAALGQLEQITEGRTPCAFFGKAIEIEPGETKTISSMYGYAESFEAIAGQRAKILSPAYLQNKRSEAQKFIQDLTEPIATQSANQLFDHYARQTFLDNVMRGGWPELLAKKHVFHVYSRKHGDPERDYNFFFLAAEHYSQGNSNYRDVNQNRRSDVFFEPRVADFNIRLFMSLIQTDGYNPLVVKGTNFTIDPEKLPGILKHAKFPQELSKTLSSSFTPGELLRAAIVSELDISSQEFLDMVLSEAKQHIQADFGEGYWVDHWTYNLDLIETYLAIYPDKKTSLLFDSAPLPFYDSPAVVNPRAKKYVLDHGRPRQFQAIDEDPEKEHLINGRSDQPNWVRSDYGNGEIFRISLFSKLVLIAILKFATRDPFGMGVEMEAGRPGWYDALNGLPGLFGSSLPEAIELLRLFNFLIEALEQDARLVELPVEANELLQDILDQLAAFSQRFEYWDRVSSARENYRAKTRLGVSGKVTRLNPEDLVNAFGQMKGIVHEGISRAVKENDGLPPTYFMYNLAEYEQTEAVDPDGHEIVRPKQFTQTRLPLFLEGPARMMKVLNSQEEARSLYANVRDRGLYDQSLHMYKLNASLLNQPHEIGRARAFSPGWLENESIWLHMSYKYLLELLKNGLYDQFFEDMQSGMPPFMDPTTYGRSLLENSSFIVSSAHPDRSLHGKGFVARLSGSTAEFLNIWHIMMVGQKPFSVSDGELQLRFRPAIPRWMFTTEGRLSFKFLGHSHVTYVNPEGKDTYSAGFETLRIRLVLEDGSEVNFDSDFIPAPYAEMVRSGNVPEIEIYYGQAR